MIVNNTLLESLWARVDTNIGSRITKISELLTQALSANTESKAARDAAAASATEAKNHADRAELATDVSGLRDEVTQQIAAVVDGSPAALDTIREVAEYAQANRGITDQLNAAIGNKADKSHTHTQAQVTGLSTALSGKADKSHTHTSADISNTTSELMSTNPNRVVRTNGDGSISIHNHTITGNYSAANKAYVDGEVAKKADSSHKHTTADITNFSTEMGKKADKSHTHSQSDITGLSTTLSGKADSTHTHTQGEVTGLTAALNGKANTSHTHTTSQISGLGTALNGKADKSYVESRPALFSGSGAPPASIPGATVGDWWLNTTTMELHKITGV